MNLQDRLMMDRNLSVLLRQELSNLEKDASSRKSAMKALKSYVKDLNSNTIPIFLAQLSETKETGCVSGEHTISLYEVLARDHGPKIVPHINTIMATVIKTLASSAGSFPLQQACAKVAPAIARYGIDPTTDEEKKRKIIQSICRLLSDSLMGSLESLTSGAALCLEALVDSDNWRFASDETVNKVCLNVAGESTQTNSHMSLVMALVKRNPLIVEPYARLLIQSGLQILKTEGNSQKCLSAIQMVNFLMKRLDARSIFSELEFVVEEMEKCQSDEHMGFVRGAAFEALETAKKIIVEKESKFETRRSSSVSGSNFSHSTRRNYRSPGSMSPESQTFNSCFKYDSLVKSSISMRQNSRDMIFDRRSANRKLWSFENGGLGISRGSRMEHAYSENICNRAPTDNGGYCAREFAGFDQMSLSHRMTTRSATPSPQRSRHHLNVDNVDIYTTPRKLVRSLQNFTAPNSHAAEKETRRFRSRSSEYFDFSPVPNQNGFSHGVYTFNGNCELHSDCELFQGHVDSESVSSSTDDALANVGAQVSHGIDLGGGSEIQKLRVEKSCQKIVPRLVLSVLFAVLSVTAIFWLDGQDEGYYRLVPT